MTMQPRAIDFDGALPSLAALRLVEAASRHRSYSSAGRELRVSHSAISQQISRLEREWGVKLFERDGVGMVPTTAGRELANAYVEASRILQQTVARVAKAA